jgi:hypothetical protein
MPKYVVRLEGEGCRIRIRREDGTVSATSGFFTTRFVEAAEPEEAQRQAFALIWNELTGIDVEGSLDMCLLSVDEIREDPQAFDEYAPGSGFTWY